MAFASAQSINVHVYVYTDESCTSQYGSVHVLTANVSRPDVNALHEHPEQRPYADVDRYVPMLHGQQHSQLRSIGPPREETITLTLTLARRRKETLA